MICKPRIEPIISFMAPAKIKFIRKVKIVVALMAVFAVWVLPSNYLVVSVFGICVLTPVEIGSPCISRGLPYALLYSLAGSAISIVRRSGMRFGDTLIASV